MNYKYKYVTGLVVGKFCPLHYGHIMVIEKALEQCENVIVLSYTSLESKGCEWYNREKWLKSLDNQSRLKIVVLNPEEIYFPADNASEVKHREFCANYLFYYLDTTVQAVFSSELYGEPFAEHLTKYFSTKLVVPTLVNHVMIDYHRTSHYISGTYLREMIKQDKYSNLHEYMPKAVRNSFVRKVLFLGAESTGKSTIASELASWYNSSLVVEFGRELYDYREHKLVYEDLAYIAKTQVLLEEGATEAMDSSYLFCDTSPLTTKFYSKEWFGRVPNALEEVLRRNINSYYKVYVCAPDFPLVQDGTRQDEAFRSKGHEFFLEELIKADVPFTILTGSLENRIERVISDLKSYSN